ncbi:MAG: hypothetical protein OQL06_01260 [Gammaproteobacteria bacterium]|nr:hypothetical protein [Gammaproteobacteria bacterium]
MKSFLCRNAARIILLFSCSVWIIDAAAVCGLDAPTAGIGISYASYADAQINTSSAYAMEQVATELNWQDELWQASHAYLSLEFPQSNLTTPVTTGDLHTLRIGVRDHWRLNQRDSLDGAILPTLAVSSSQLKNPDLLKLDAFRLDAHLLWHHLVLKKTRLFLGYCLGALAGEYSAMPIIGVDYKSTDWQLSLGYPATRFSFDLQPALRFFTDWSLSGNQWQVLDSNLQNRSDVNFESQQLSAGFIFSFPRYGEVEIYWRHLFDQQLEYLARNGALLSVEPEDSDGWMVGYRHYF